VAFRAVNADVRPETAITDSTGRVAVDVTLSERAGVAAVIAMVDSVERVHTMQVEPGFPVGMAIEFDGARVDGGVIEVLDGVPFALRLRVRDSYGNPARIAEVVRAVRNNLERFRAKLMLLELLAVVEDGATAVLTFKPVREGRSTLNVVAGDGLTAKVAVVVGRRPR
jgi:hypothetical protein